jgi:murein DD-endopeptidase
MGIKWNNLMENERKQFEKMSEHDKFVYFLLLQFGSPYGWGKENPVSSDCSVAVCMALFAATGFLIRTTADDLLKRVFTKINPRQGEIRAVFYVTKKGKKHGDGYAAAGTATHVAGILDDGVILNSQEPYARIRRINDVSDWYQREGHEVLVRGLDYEALARLAREGKPGTAWTMNFSIFLMRECDYARKENLF